MHVRSKNKRTMITASSYKVCYHSHSQGQCQSKKYSYSYYYQSFWHTIKLYLFVPRILQLQSPLEIANGNQTIVITAQSNQSIKKSTTVSQAPPTKLYSPPILTSQTALRPLEKVRFKSSSAH